MQVTLLNNWGTDLTVVNNARVSFDKESEWGVLGLKTEDEKLIGFLARGCTSGQWTDLKDEMYEGTSFHRIESILNHVKNMPTHWAPFANGIGAQFRIKVPIPIMRQLFKTKVGTVESEVSRRYVSSEPEMFRPKWRMAAENVKQGSSDTIFAVPPMMLNVLQLTDVGPVECSVPVDDELFFQFCTGYYNHLIEQGVCAEQARFVLPQAMYTEAIISNSLYGWANVYNQRKDRNHAQREVADVVDLIAAEMSQLYPVSWRELTK
jgi:thymidylate synthase (FAD)